MKFGSWTYDQAQVDIVNKTEGIDVTHYITNGEWELIATKIQRNEVSLNKSTNISLKWPNIAIE